LRAKDSTVNIAGNCGHAGQAWTQSILISASSIYRPAGFKLVGTNAHSEFGPRLVGETSELEL
jgi:hypothetical protein